MSIEPLVSVRTPTYNHEKYIAQCLESILMQRTRFPFEVIIGEDCSTDRTREIVLDYQRKYPEKIQVIISEENVGPTRNSLRIQQACRGKYHAICEGDDYWIDPLKLQKQVDFMEAHPDVTMSFHNAFIVKEDDFSTRLFFTSTMKEMLAFADVCSIGIPVASIMARSEILDTLPEWRLNIWHGDTLFRLWCAHHGNLGYVNEIMSVYRVHSGGLMAMMRLSLEKGILDELFVYQRFDQETNYQHTDPIQMRIKHVKAFYRQKQLGRCYYLLYPHRLIAKFKKYYMILDRQRRI
jgi:glycosyltransferase involved in cell wall biosynthesis